VQAGYAILAVVPVWIKATDLPDQSLEAPQRARFERPHQTQEARGEHSRNFCSLQVDCQRIEDPGEAAHDFGIKLDSIPRGFLRSLRSQGETLAVVRMTSWSVVRRQGGAC